MFKHWRALVLIILLFGPVLAYIGFGALWLRDRGWLLIAGALWIASGIVFSVLAARWTRTKRELLPPLDWDAPQTFSPFDREAWKIVEEESEQGDALDQDALSGVDVYMETGRRLTRRLAQHYHPLSTDPIEHVPLVELLTALELAAEDLNGLCRQVPGGDMVTPAHWKRAVQVAGYLQRANDIYSYLLPIFSPVTGLVRLGTQQWMVKPAWKNMQQNLLRWFFRAYVNRLGTHLVELYSGRLAIGADQYRRLTRKSARVALAMDGELGTISVAVAGARDSGKTRLIAALDEARTGDLTLARARLGALGLDETWLDRLKSARWVEVPGYTVTSGGESARDRATRREAIEAAVEADLLLLVIDGRRDSHTADIAFAQGWDRWYVEHPGLEVPPALAVVTAVDTPEFDVGADWKPPYQWTKGQGTREVAVRARLESLRATLPPTFRELVAVGLPEDAPFGIVEHLLPTLSALMHLAERAALVRHLHHVSTRSKARRLVSQVGEHGRWLWKNLTARRHAPAETAESGQTPS
ncbi:MAG: GTPase [Isosphaeraceae bacterium]|nr:GTPase [Isosphaeraceae bacterium]